MSHARPLLLACALVVAACAPPREHKCEEPKMVQQEKTIVVRRVPIAYFYPFSLWPLPKYPPREDRENSHDTYHYRRNLKSVRNNQNNR